MARIPKGAQNIQVFRGSRPKPDVFAQTSGDGCCGSGLVTSYDKLAERTRFDNGLAHLNPTGANDKYFFPDGNGFNEYREDIIAHINSIGVGATISVIALPTYAYVTGVGVHIASEEPGLTFNLLTRNGLVLPQVADRVTATVDPAVPCGLVRTREQGVTGDFFSGFGALGDALFIDLLAVPEGGVTDHFCLEADELILQVATMPADGFVTGAFKLTVAANYDVINRAEA